MSWNPAPDSKGEDEFGQSPAAYSKVSRGRQEAGEEEHMAGSVGRSTCPQSPI